MAKRSTQQWKKIHVHKCRKSDRRTLLGEWKIELCLDSSKIKVRHAARDQPIGKGRCNMILCGPMLVKTFDDLPSFEEHIQEKKKKFCYDQVKIYLPVKEKGKQEIPLDLDRILQAVGKFTYYIMICFQKPDNSPVVVEQIFDAFFENRLVKEIYFDFRNYSRKLWEHYRPTMRTRAEAKGWAVQEPKGRGHHERCYRKIVEKRKPVLEMLW